MKENYFPILIYSVVVIGLAVTFLFMAQYFGPRRKSRQKLEPYECGVELFDNYRQKFHVKFYLIATFFILFDIETVFLIPWAVAFKEMSFIAVFEMLFFLFILGIGLIYILKKRVFDWD